MSAKRSESGARWGAGALLICAASHLGCEEAQDATELCFDCVVDDAEVRETERLARPGPEYAFLDLASLSPSELTAAWQGLAYERIGLTRTSCFSNCPEYSLVFIRGNGDETRARVLYNGTSAVPNLGAFEGAIGIREYAELCRIADRLDVLELEPEYRAPWPGDASAIVEVRHVSGDFRLVDYGRQGPAELTAFEWALDGAAMGIDWQPLLAE